MTTAPNTSELEILSTSRFWRATPWDYNSLIGLTFFYGGDGEMTYAYGQTIYAVIKLRFTINSSGLLTLTFQNSPPQQFFKGFVPVPGTPPRECRFSLRKEEFVGEEVNAGPFKYHWNLSLDSFPFPEELNLPPVIRLPTGKKSDGSLPYKEVKLPAPLTYYGHKAGVRAVSFARGRPIRRFFDWLGLRTISYSISL